MNNKVDDKTIKEMVTYVKNYYNSGNEKDLKKAFNIANAITKMNNNESER